MHVHVVRARAHTGIRCRKSAGGVSENDTLESQESLSASHSEVAKKKKKKKKKSWNFLLHILPAGAKCKSNSGGAKGRPPRTFIAATFLTLDRPTTAAALECDRGRVCVCVWM